MFNRAYIQTIRHTFTVDGLIKRSDEISAALGRGDIDPCDNPFVHELAAQMAIVTQSSDMPTRYYTIHDVETGEYIDTCSSFEIMEWLSTACCVTVREVTREEHQAAMEGFYG